MENIAVLKRSGFKFENRKEIKQFDSSDSSVVVPIRTPVINKLLPEGEENFFNYLDWLGLSNDPNMIILSSKLHYYYDYEELRSVTTLLNLKKLNMIKHLDAFLNNIYNILPPKTNFIGCFSDRKIQKRTSLVSRIYKKVINYIDSRIEYDLSRYEVIKIFNSHGFVIVNMTDINGLTYFRIQNR
jgi:hypothetical protein